MSTTSSGKCCSERAPLGGAAALDDIACVYATGVNRRAERGEEKGRVGGARDGEQRPTKALHKREDSSIRGGACQSPYSKLSC